MRQFNLILMRSLGWNLLYHCRGRNF
ncbi:hypothetical protein Pint_28156 [Pistacia integerrima]|uniref:Uncharacterized protein n=1 Tax=Pistacia integerrima TaxID=434235 RepID=A0ACC0YUB8_9ROSI|nr:hypothetical protein Pint_28156 [Pistacia integerrima]